MIFFYFDNSQLNVLVFYIALNVFLYVYFSIAHTYTYKYLLIHLFPITYFLPSVVLCVDTFLLQRNICHLIFALGLYSVGHRVDRDSINPSHIDPK